MNKKLFGKNLTYLKWKDDVSIDLLVEVTKAYDRQVCRNWLLGKCYPSVERLIDISEFFGVTIDELVKEDLKARDQKN